MALFTGRSGDANLSRQRYAAALAHKDAMNVRRNAADVMEEYGKTPGVLAPDPTGAMPEMRTIAPEQPEQPAPQPAPSQGNLTAADRAIQTPQPAQPQPEQSTLGQPNPDFIDRFSQQPGEAPAEWAMNYIGQLPDYAMDQLAALGAATARGTVQLVTRPGETRQQWYDRVNKVRDYVQGLANGRIGSYLYGSGGQGTQIPGATPGTMRLPDGSVSMPVPAPGQTVGMGVPSLPGVPADQVLGTPFGSTGAVDVNGKQNEAFTYTIPINPNSTPQQDFQAYQSAQDYNTREGILNGLIQKYGGRDAAMSAMQGAMQGAQQQVAQTPTPTTPAGVKTRETTIQNSTRKVTEQVREEAGVSELPKGPVKDALTKKKLSPPKPIVDVQLLNNELQQGIAKRKQLFMMADVYKRSGMGVQFIEAIGALEGMTATVNNLTQQKGINLFERNGDPRMLQAMWQAKTGQQIQIIPRSDGKWDIVKDGVTTHEGVEKAAIVSSARGAATQEFVTSTNAAAVARAQARAEARWKMEELALGKRWDHFTKTEQELLKREGQVKEDSEGNMWAIVNGRWVAMKQGDTPNIDEDGDPVQGINSYQGPAVGPGGQMSMGTIMDSFRSAAGLKG